MVAADPLEPDRLNVHEEWDSEAELEAFRSGGSGPQLTAEIVHADMTRHHVVGTRLKLGAGSRRDRVARRHSRR